MSFTNWLSDSLGLSSRPASRRETPAARRTFRPRLEALEDRWVPSTLTSASWLNQVERFFAEITEKRIRRSAFRRVKALEQAIADYLAEHNATPKPFVWTATAELILKRVEEHCKRPSNSGH